MRLKKWIGLCLTAVMLMMALAAFAVIAQACETRHPNADDLVVRAHEVRDVVNYGVSQKAESDVADVSAATDAGDAGVCDAEAAVSEAPAACLYGEGCCHWLNCPLNHDCVKLADHRFSDEMLASSAVLEAATYLYNECALGGGKLRAGDKIMRGEALEIVLKLFRLMGGCGGTENFTDVYQGDWPYEVVNCALKYGLVKVSGGKFKPYSQVTFAEAARMLVVSAVRFGIIDIHCPAAAIGGGNFVKIPSSHWAYQYVETLYAYGVVGAGVLGRSADEKIGRDEFVLMAAKMSPCYCENVVCKSCQF